MASKPPRAPGHRRVFSESAVGYAPLRSEDGADQDWKQPVRAMSPPATALELVEEGLDSPSSSEAPSETRHSLGEEATAQADSRLLASLRMPRSFGLAALCALGACMLVTPLVFDSAVTGDALWGPFARPGTYLNVQVLRAQGLPRREASVSPRHPADSDSDADAGPGPETLRNPYINVRTWPWSRSGEQYYTRVMNGSLAPVWNESFTFDQGDFRARKVSLVLFDAPRPGERGWGTQLGIALIPVPAQGAPPVDIGARETLQPVAGAIIEGWFPFSQRSAEADYEASDDGLPNGEVFARVSFAQRRADSGYCEQVRVESPVAQPVDSYSNFLFLCTGTHMVAVGAADFARARAARAGVRTPMMSGMQRFPVYSIVNGATQFYAGASSFLFHASMTELGQRLDMAGVYMLVATPALYMLLRLGTFGPPHWRAAHTTFTTLDAFTAFALFKYKYFVERSVGGSTELVISMIVFLTALLALWLWILGEPGDLLRHQGSADILEVLSAEAYGGEGGGGVWGRVVGAMRQKSGRWDRLDRSSDAGAVELGGMLSSRIVGGAGGAVPPASASPVKSLARALRRRQRPRDMHYRYAVACVFCIVIAYGSREADVRYGMWCFPTSPFQLHALWHVLAASSLYFLWLFMRSEAPPGWCAGTGSSDALLPPPPPASASPSPSPASTPRFLATVPAPVEASGLVFPCSQPAAGAEAAAEVGSPRARGAAVLETAAALGLGIGGAEEGPVGVPAGTRRSAQHLRTRSRGQGDFFLPADMV